MPVVGGNWKMHTDLASAVELADDVVAGCADVVERCDVVLFPPFPYLQAVGHTLGHHGLALGAQNVHWEASGAFTGEVSAPMLADLNVATVLAGHSERRHVMGEDDAQVNRKVLAALAGGLSVVICVGETLRQREAGAADAVNAGQLRAGLADVSAADLRRLVIAYEPVWAIGTGRTATPEDAQAAHAAIRSTLASLYDDSIAAATRIQYGGSVKASNAPDLFAQPDIDGGLIGGASLQADEFVAIVHAAAGTA
jgi:triosephosphate isomerase